MLARRYGQGNCTKLRVKSVTVSLVQYCFVMYANDSRSDNAELVFSTSALSQCRNLSCRDGVPEAVIYLWLMGCIEATRGLTKLPNSNSYWSGS